MGRKLSFTGIAAGGGGGGGGGGSTGTFGTIHDDATILGTDDDNNYQCNESYSSMGRQFGGLKGHQFYFAWMQEYNSNNNRTRQRIKMFSVNRSTGAITQQGGGNVWLNNSGRAISTTCYYNIEGTGSGCSGGNNAYPGHSSHVFGYDYWQVYSGNITGSGTYSQDSHQTNGTYNGLCSNSDNVGRNFIVGYQQGNNPWGQPSRSCFRKWSSQNAGNSPSVGGREWPSNPHTSTCYPGHIYPQASNSSSESNVQQGSNGLTSICCMSVSNPNYAWYTQDGNGNHSDYFTGSGENGRPTGLQFQDGTVIWKKSNSSSQFYQSNSYSSHTAIDVASYASQNVTGRDSYCYNWAGLSGDYWITGFRSDKAVSWGIPLQIVKITKGNVAQGGGTVRTHLFNPDYEIYGACDSKYHSMYPLWENTSDAYPKKVVYMIRSGKNGRALVSDLPDSSDWAT